jgi:3-methyladenine DNA glycosylase/8-oxoguanine DNA glycosylase
MIRSSLPIDGIDVAGTIRLFTTLAGDPCVNLTPGRFVRATITPDGPGTCEFTWSSDARAEVTAHGDGAAWLTERAGALIGCDDDPDGFEPTMQPLRDVWRRRRGIRVPRTSTVWHDLAWWIVQQRVTRADAAASWRLFVRRFGTPAPGVGDLVVPPLPATVAALSYHDLHPMGLERRRAAHLIDAARCVARLADLGDATAADALPVITTVPGVGPWTTSCMAVSTWGDPDAVIVGDAGIPSLVAWVLARERRADDARMHESLAPYRPHRYRVIQLAFASGMSPPRRQPHLARQDIRRR